MILTRPSIPGFWGVPRTVRSAVPCRFWASGFANSTSGAVRIAIRIRIPASGPEGVDGACAGCAELASSEPKSDCGLNPIFCSVTVPPRTLRWLVPVRLICAFATRLAPGG